MGRTLTNEAALVVAREASVNGRTVVGVLPGEQGQPGTPDWQLIEPNTIGDFGATISTTARTPITNDRQERAGTTTDLDSAAGYSEDTTLSALDFFGEGFLFAAKAGPSIAEPSAVTSSAYTVSGLTTALTQNTLVLARGFNIAGNNGLKVVGSGGTTTSVPATGLVAEGTAPNNATVEVAGFRTAAGDLDVTSVVQDSNGADVVTITSASNAFDNANLNLMVGMGIYFGGAAAANRFSEVTNRGYAILQSVASDGSQITVIKTDDQWVVESNAAQAVDFYVGSFIRNVRSTDPSFREISYQFGLINPNLFPNAATGYTYAKGNYGNTMGISLPLTDKSTVEFGFIGTDTDDPVSTPKVGSDNARERTRTEALNTVNDCVRLSVNGVDGNGIATRFKEATITINNNVSPEKVLCVLGAAFMNYGNYQINIEATVLFDNPSVPTAIRANTTVNTTVVMQNTDGAVMLDIPSMKLGGGNKNYPVNESIQISLTGNAFKDPVLGYTTGITLFPYIPEE